MIQTQPTPRTKPGLTPSLLNPAWTAGRETPVQGLYAVVTLDGLTAEVSKMAGETAWTIDALWSAHGGPIFSNGYGARYLMTRKLAADVARELDAATPRWRPVAKDYTNAAAGI